MGQFDFLLNSAKGIDAPSPLDLTTRALTLGNLANQYQGGQIGLTMQRAMLAAMQDPSYAGAMGQIFDEATGQSGAATQPGQPSALQAWVERNPIGALQVMGQRAQLMTAFSQVNKNNADAAQASTSARIASQNQFANFATKLANQHDPVSPTQQQMALSLGGRVLPPDMFMAMRTAMMQPDGGASWFASFGASGANPAQQATATSTLGLLGPKIGLTGAQTAEAAATAAATPARTQAALTEAGAAAQRAGAAALAANTGAAKALAPQVITDTQGNSYLFAPVGSVPGFAGNPASSSGAGSVAQSPSPVTSPAPGVSLREAGFAPINPQEAAALGALKARIAQGGSGAFAATPNGPLDVTNSVSMPVAGASVVAQTATPRVAPLTTASGSPIQTKLSPQQEAQVAQTAKTVGDMQKAIPNAYQALDLLNQARSLDAQGIYSGGIKGTEFFQNLANIYASTPLASPDVVSSMANTQAWSKETGQLVLQMLRTMPGNRFTNNELNFIRNVNPTTLQQPAARTKIYDLLQRGIMNSITFAKSAGAYTAQPGVTNLSGWTPPGFGASIPRISSDDGYNALPSGALFIGPDGQQRRKP